MYTLYSNHNSHKQHIMFLELHCRWRRLILEFHKVSTYHPTYLSFYSMFVVGTASADQSVIKMMTITQNSQKYTEVLRILGAKMEHALNNLN